MSAVATALLFLGANSLWGLEQPDRGAPAEEIVDFYTDLSTRIEIGGLLSMLSIAGFVVFAAAIRSVLIGLERDALLADVAFGGTILGLAAGIGAESINMAAAVRAGDGELTESLAIALFDISYVLGFNAAGIGIGVATIALSVAALRSGALLPQWLAVLGAALGVALLTPLSQVALGPVFVFLLILGLILLRKPDEPAVAAREH